MDAFTLVSRLKLFSPNCVNRLMDSNKLTELRNSGTPILIFDGECGFCQASVKFILCHERIPRLHFVSRQSTIGKELITAFGHDKLLVDSLMIVDNEKIFLRSDAVILAGIYMGGLWRLLWLGKFIPRFIRDGLYQFIANRRLKFMRQPIECLIPVEKFKSRFIDF